MANTESVTGSPQIYSLYRCGRNSNPCVLTAANKRIRIPRGFTVVKRGYGVKEVGCDQIFVDNATTATVQNCAKNVGGCIVVGKQVGDVVIGKLPPSYNFTIAILRLVCGGNCVYPNLQP